MSKSNTLTKLDLIALVAKDLNSPKTTVEAVLGGLISSITSSLANGDKVAITGFATFSVSERAARKGRNPKTGKEISIPAKKVVKIKVGKSLQDSVE